MNSLRHPSLTALRRIHLLHARGSPVPPPDPPALKAESDTSQVTSKSENDDSISEKVKELVLDDSTVPSEAPHVDERQVGLDTDRSFVLYPIGVRHPRQSR